MKKLLYIVIATLGLASCSNSRVVITEADMPEDMFYLDDEIKPYTGKAIIYFSGTEIIKEELTYKRGILNGEAISYFQNGKIKRRGEYKMGRLTGKWQSWYENGKKKYEVDYTNDTLSGAFTLWYATGVVKIRGSYSENNRVGQWIEYDEAGMVMNKHLFN
jgi:antitoxin component YwqK of YwqJK toxin-antitoxin module